MLATYFFLVKMRRPTIHPLGAQSCPTLRKLAIPDGRDRGGEYLRAVELVPGWRYLFRQCTV